MTLFWVVVAICAFGLGYDLGKDIKAYDEYTRGYNKGFKSAKDFYRPIAKRRIEKDMAIKKEQLN